MRILFLLVLGVAVTTAVPTRQQRIVGGSITDIRRYPFTTALIFSWTGAGVFSQSCGGSIITLRTVLSAAHCFIGDRVNQWRARAGSTNANSGGRVYNFNRILIHPNYNPYTFDSDVAVLRTTANIATGANVAVGQIAAATYHLPDNTQVWAVGWGLTSYRGLPSEQLRHVQIWTINQITCRQRYATLGSPITDNMLCSGWLDVGGRDACSGDSGGPLLHNNVVVGITSWGEQCALARFPGVNVRVSRFTSWIQANA